MEDMEEDVSCPVCICSKIKTCGDSHHGHASLVK